MRSFSFSFSFRALHLHLPGRVSLDIPPKAEASIVRSRHRELTAGTIRTYRNIGVERIRLARGTDLKQALQTLRSDPDVEVAEPNYRFRIHATPNDTHFSKLWGLHNTGQSVNNTSGTADADIDAPEAWDIISGATKVIVAVIDSGVDYNHPDLAANIWTNPGEIPGNSIDDDGNGKVDDVRGWDFVDEDNDPMDYNGHGTHVAGIIGAVGNNSVGVAGVSCSAKIMALRVLDTAGYGWTSDLIEAIEYANAEGAHVINLSLGGMDFSQLLKDAICASPALVVCSAGNDGTDNDTTPNYPSSYDSPNIISVAATGELDNLLSNLFGPGGSNYGAKSVHVAAPGANIYSTMPARQSIWSDSFSDGSISDWTTGGPGNRWGISSECVDCLNSLADSPSGSYDNSTNSWAQSPGLNLSGHTGIRLDFWFYGLTEENHDFIYLDTSSDGSNWANRYPDQFSGSTWPNWYLSQADLKDIAGHNPAYFRFRFTSDSSTTLDDVEVSASSTTYNGTEYEFMDGTSMSAAYVSGIAALVKSQKPTFTNVDLKAAIMDGAVPKTSLNGKTVTGGRVNAYNALTQPILNYHNLTKSISAAHTHSLVCKTNGRVWAWGNNSYGGFSCTTAVQVVNLTNVVAIATGTYHSMALKTDGTLWAWGYNVCGQLGDGTTTTRTTPVQVPGISDVIAMSGGACHSMVIRSDRTVWGWGANQGGQLGDGSIINRTIPVQVSNLADVVAVDAGYYFTIALKEDGTVWAWGTNFLGELGDDTTTDRTTPVQVVGPGGSGFLNLVSLVVPQDVTEGDGVLSAQGLVRIDQALTYNLTVPLYSSGTTEITVPASVTIPAGQTSATFDITVLDDTALDGPNTVTITASPPGFPSVGEKITVQDNDTPIAGLALDFGSGGMREFNGSTWSQLTGSNPEYMCTYGNELVGDFGAGGVWQFDGTTWQKITSSNPENAANAMIGVNLYQ